MNKERGEGHQGSYEDQGKVHTLEFESIGPQTALCKM